MKCLVSLCLLVSLNIVSAQQHPSSKPKADPPSPARGLALQMLSVRRQLGVDEKAAGDGFFSTPWPKSAAMAASTASAAPPDCPPIGTDEGKKLVDAAAKNTGLRADLLQAVIQRESAFKPCAESFKGAQGLMQLMPATAQQFGVQDPFDPKQNVDAGSKYLKQLVDKYGGDLKLALSAYNAGPANVTVEQGIPDIAETKEYVRDILSKIPEIQ